MLRQHGDNQRVLLDHRKDGLNKHHSSHVATILEDKINSFIKDHFKWLRFSGDMFLLILFLRKTVCSFTTLAVDGLKFFETEY